MKLCLIVNPNAGKKRGRAAADRAAAVLEKNDIEYSLLYSSYPGEAVKLAEEVDQDVWDGIIAVGGDGTLFEVLNGLFGKNKKPALTLGQIPVGTGNSFSKDLGIETEDHALEAIIDNSVRPVDIGRFSYEKGSYYFINLLGAGFVSNVAHTADRFKHLGALSYIIGVLKETVVLKSTSIELDIDGESIQRRGIFVEICNSRYTGGAMLMAPGAKIDDGFLDVILANKISRRKLLRLFPQIFKGTHVDDPDLEVFRCKKVKLITGRPQLLTPDGETFGTTPLEAEVLPSAVRMFSL